MPKIALVDNYDSFTWNLVHALGMLGAEVEVHRNDQITVDAIERSRPDAIVISPGPCTPNEAGISLEVVKKLGDKMPILGVCLGHQTIGAAYGGDVVRAGPVHGKLSKIKHEGKGVMRGINDNFEATRYHSLVVKRDTMPKDLEVTAETGDGLVMALSHKTHPVHGVQFHPESIASEHGQVILKNFLDLAAQWNSKNGSKMERFRNLIGKAATGAALTREESAHAFDKMMSGEATPSQMGGFLMALRVRGETVDEIAGAVATMRAKMTTVKAPADAIDVVGTGGDGAGSYNISTCAAFIVAGAGVPVAKHGNRALSSKSGAADVLMALGVKVDLEPAAISRCIKEAGIGFMFAPAHHPAMKHVGPTRVELGTRTMFNLLGPLSNPAGVKRQMVGVYSKQWVEPVAEVLKTLGSEGAWVVHGSDGLDEITTTGPTFVAELKNGKIKTFEVKPEDAGLKKAKPEDLKGGDGAHNAKALQAVLAGTSGAYRDIALLNAAASLVVAGKANALAEGAKLAAQSIDTGAAKARLEKLITVSNG